MTMTNLIDQKEFDKFFTPAGLAMYRYIEDLRMIGYFTAPGSKGHHLARPRGLYDHSRNVTENLVRMTESMNVDWPRKESPYLVGLLHDLVKCKCYRAVETDPIVKYEYVQPEYPGHGIASVMIAQELGIELLPEEMVAITYHMGMFGVGKEYTDKEFNAALAKFPQQIIATHCADWYAARVNEEFVND